MECKVEKTQNANEVKLEIKIEAEKFNAAIKKVYFQSAKYFNIPGFRKGKAPQQIVEKYYGKEIFYEDAFNDLVPDEYEKALEENKIEAVSRPQIDIITMEKGQDLVFTATVQTKPEVELGKYKGIEIPKIEYNVKDADIDEQIKQMQEKNARLVSIETPVENGNIAVIDFEGFVDGNAFEGGKAENHELEIGSGSFIPGFEDQIVGMKVEEEKDVVVTFPEEYYSKELAGKEATFKVKLHEIKKKELPELDDEFAKDVSEFDTIKELKDSIKEKLEKQNADREKYEKQDAVLKVVCEEMKADIPSGMVEMEIDNMVKDMEQRMSYQGLKLEQYLQMLGKTEEEFRKEYEPQATDAIKSRLALEAIVKAEKIEATEEDIKSKLEEMAKNYGKKPEELQENENIKNYIKQGIENEKALELLVENSKVKKSTAKKQTKAAEDKEETKKESKTKKAE
ncbi:MAG: trigger factor [Clostridia bacterium]|nr:trigger factor [Clostridia bacterium]